MVEWFSYLLYYGGRIDPVSKATRSRYKLFYHLPYQERMVVKVNISYASDSIGSLSTCIWCAFFLISRMMLIFVRVSFVVEFCFGKVLVLFFCLHEHVGSLRRKWSINLVAEINMCVTKQLDECLYVSSRN